MAGQPIIATERLLLREFDEGDIDAYYVLGSDPAIIRYTGDPGGGFANRDEALTVLRSRPLADYAKHGFGRWARVERASGAVIGFAGLKRLEDVREIDLGYRFMPAYWGRGLATEAARAVLDYGFTRLGLDCIVGLVAPDNHASIRILEKLGFSLVGALELGGLSALKYTLARGPTDK